MSIETVSFTKDGLLQKTPAHNYSEFRFRIFASYAFRVFRRIFEIDTDFFLSSLCSEPMVELTAAGGMYNFTKFWLKKKWINFYYYYFFIFFSFGFYIFCDS